MSHTFASAIDDVTDPGLFDAEPWRVEIPEPEPVEKLSADRRRTIRQREAIAKGIHPLSAPLRYPEWRPLRLHTEDGRTCGNCRFRGHVDHHNRTYPKCWFNDEARVSNGAATDVRAWWPGCTDHEWGDTKLSPDAARSGPSVVERGE